jgi:Predicted membrane protein
MIKTWKTLTASEKVKHVILYLIGVGIMPLGVVLTINAHLGSGGYDALNFALSDVLKINTSITIYGTAFIILIITAIIRRGFPRIQTFISSLLLGVFTDLWKLLLKGVEGTEIISQVIMFLLGMIVIGFAVACYMISIFPTNPSDDFLVAMKEKNVNIGLAKIILDGVCVVLALILRGEIGVGTIICTFGLGPVINLFYKFVKKILHIKEN